MSKSTRASSPSRDGYRWQTHRPLHGLVFVGPLLVFFHAGAVWYDTALLAPRHIEMLLRLFGAGAWAPLPSVAVLAVLVAQHFVRRDPLKVQPRVLAGMVAESVLWFVPLIVLSYMTGMLMTHSAAAQGSPGVMHEVFGAVGAGVYEEFIFRLMLISLVMLLAVDVFELPKEWVAAGAVLLSAAAFSAYHFVGRDTPSWGLFAFRAMAGVYLGTLYVLRGYGIVVGAHILFNLYVIVVRNAVA